MKCNTSRFVRATAMTMHLLNYRRAVNAHNAMLLPGEPHIVFEPEFPTIPYNKYTKPHAGSRECARRRGGEAWESFKASDRLRRGLAV